MPLTEEQKAAIATIAGADAEEVADALKNEANPVYNRVFGAGVTTGKNELKPKLTAAETELATARADTERLTGELAELKQKTPDRAAIDAQWQTRLDADVKKVTDKLTAAEQRVARLTTDTTAEKIENALLGTGFRPRLAKLLAKDGTARISYDDDGKPVLKDAATGTPIQIPDGKSPFEVLAEQEKTAADPADLLSGVDTGGGATGGGAGKVGGDVRKSVETTASYTL